MQARGLRRQEISDSKRKPGGLYPTLVVLLNSKGEWSLGEPKTFKTREAAERYLARNPKGQVKLGVSDRGCRPQGERK